MTGTRQCFAPRHCGGRAEVLVPEQTHRVQPLVGANNRQGVSAARTIGIRLLLRELLPLPRRPLEVRSSRSTMIRSEVPLNPRHRKVQSWIRTTLSSTTPFLRHRSRATIEIR